MNDRAFRLDFFIAIAALVVSILTTATLIYQTHVIQEQYSATIWPYLNLNTRTQPSRIVVALANNGLGPALIRSAQLTVDGRNTQSWKQLVGILGKDAARAAHRKDIDFPNSTGSIDQSTAIRPGEELRLIDLIVPKGVPLSAVNHHKVVIDVCYCSLNGHCWRLRASPGISSGSTPQDAPACPVAARIDA